MWAGGGVWCWLSVWRSKPALAATAFLIASPWQCLPNNLCSAASSGSIGARPLKLGTGRAQYRCSRPLLSPAGQDRASIFGEQRFIICNRVFKQASVSGSTFFVAATVSDYAVREDEHTCLDWLMKVLKICRCTGVTIIQV